MDNPWGIERLWEVLSWCWIQTQQSWHRHWNWQCPQCQACPGECSSFALISIFNFLDESFIYVAWHRVLQFPFRWPIAWHRHGNADSIQLVHDCTLIKWLVNLWLVLDTILLFRVVGRVSQKVWVESPRNPIYALDDDPMFVSLQEFVVKDVFPNCVH